MVLSLLWPCLLDVSSFILMAGETSRRCELGPANKVPAAALSTFPAGLYILIEKFILHSSTPVTGARFAIRSKSIVQY